MTLTPEQQAEIAEARSVTRPTLRATVPTAWKNTSMSPTRCWTTGWSASSTTWATMPPSRRPPACRYGRGTKAVQNDEGLIRYLMRHWHSTPFEMCEVKFHVKLPVFVARQWIRHRTANVNEYSARYSILDREFYIPAPENLAAQSTVNNQGRGELLQGDEAAARARHPARRRDAQL
jgi:thymidylate synthase (FAD)